MHTEAAAKDNPVSGAPRQELTRLLSQLCPQIIPESHQASGLQETLGTKANLQGVSGLQSSIASPGEALQSKSIAKGKSESEKGKA